MPEKEFKCFDVKDREERQKTQLLLSCIIVAVVVIAWIAGRFATVSTSIFVCLFLIILVFTVWYRKSSRLLEQTMKAEELKVHQRKALRNEETAEWLNFILNRWWTFSEASLYEMFKMNLDPAFEYAKPGFIDTMELVEFSFGGCTPCVKFIKAFEGSPNENSTEVENGIRNPGNKCLVLDMDILMIAPDSSIVIKVRLGGKLVGAEVDVAVEDISISGRVQVLIELNHVVPFPHMKAASITFLEKPDVGFDVRMLKALQVMDIPMVKDFINSLVMESLTVALVDPEHIYIPLCEIEGEENSPKKENTSYAIGVLTVTVAKEIDDQSSEEAIWLTLILGDQERTLEIRNTNVKESKSCSFLVYDLMSDKCSIEMKGRRSLGTKYVIAKHKLSLKKLNLEKSPETAIVLEKTGTKGSRLETSLVYTELQQIDVQNQSREEFLDKYNLNETGNEVSGVVLVFLHKGVNLLPMDSDGYSDPYCIITTNNHKIFAERWNQHEGRNAEVKYIDRDIDNRRRIYDVGKRVSWRVKITEHIPKSINPVWESYVEFPVKDISQIILSFLVYDRDNNWQSKSDDFMGSCKLRLSLDTKVVIRHEVELLYKIFGGKNSEDVVVKAGSICISVVFRPVASVSLSEALYCLPSEGVRDGEDLRGININGKPHSAKTMPKSKKLIEGLLLCRERGVLVLSILQARNLVPMDSNGLSDPFCVVLVDQEKKWKTEVVKENLEPIWNESFSMPMLTENENLHINVFDKDIIKHDFMGKVSLSVAEVLETAQHETPVWFTLSDTESGEIQLSFEVDTSNSQVESLEETGNAIAPNAMNVENSVDSLTETHEEVSAGIPDILYKLSGEIIQAELEGVGSVSAKIKLEIPRKGRSRGSMRRKFESLNLLKTNPVSAVEGKIKWNAVFKAEENLAISKESVIFIELKSNERKQLSKFSSTLDELLERDVKYSHQKGCYTFQKWLIIPSESNVITKLEMMVTFSGGSDALVDHADTKISS